VFEQLILMRTFWNILLRLKGLRRTIPAGRDEKKPINECWNRLHDKALNQDCRNTRVCVCVTYSSS